MTRTDVHADLTESDDDTISLTSTQYDSENPDKEYVVEDILAESRDQDGGQIYLVQWAGYPLEECTWEPKENLENVLEHLWETKRRKPDFKPFDFRILLDAVNRKTDRHIRRNEARRRRNLPLTEPTNPDVWLGPAIPAWEDDSSPEAPPSDATGRAGSNDVDVEMVDDGGEGGSLKEGSRSAAIFIADGKDTLNPSDDDVVVLDALSTRPQPKKKRKRKDKMKETSPNAVNSKKNTKVTTSREPTIVAAGSNPKPTTEKNTTKETKSVANNKPAMQRTTSLPGPQPTATSNRKETNPPAPVPDSKKTFSARKSGLAYGSQSKGANVFTGGKKRTRIMKSEPSKKQDFFFPNLRVRRMADVRMRQKEDREIDPKRITKLFPIASGQPSLPVAGDTGQRASATTGHSDEAVKKPKKKSVRFSGAEEIEPSGGAATGTPVTPSVENTPFFDGDTIFHEPEQLPTTTQSVTKTLALGEQGRPVKARFSGVPLPEGSNAVLLQAFLDEELLLFGYMCLAATFLNKYGGIRQRVLFSGGIASVSTAEDENARVMLDTSAERLRAMASCLVFARPAYIVVLYPVRSDEWKDEPFGRPLPDDASDSVLRYLAFSTPFDCTPFLQPLHDTAPLWEQGISPKIQDRARLMRAFFELNWGMYSALLPQKGRPKHVKRNFFLAFPPSASSATQQMAFWLRSVDPNCVLYLSANPGAWMAFQEKVVADSEAGVVLVHEVATWTIRRFPGITDLLLTDAKHCKFWCVSQSILSPPLYPSPRLQPDTAIRHNDQVYRPGRIRIVKLFPGGLAVFLTPSFIVTEPKRTFALLEWFYNRRLSSTGGVTLVTPGNICKYLRAVADEKARQREEILENKDFRALSDRDDAALKMGIDAASCEDHYKAWLIATEICALPQTSDWCVFQADDAIDSNDEQSLVNWFGWWSTVYMDQFRLLYVVGSKGAIKTKESGRGRCRIRMPRFTPGTVASSDDIGRVLVKAPQPIAAGTDNQPPPSRTYPGVFTAGFSKHLRRFYRTDQTWKIYGYPVLWKNYDEAFRYGCVDPAHSTMQKWFTYTWPFKATHQAYIGLFYPIDEDVHSALSWDRRPRHPWLVVYRPVNNIHGRPQSETELVFWDPRAERRYSGQPHIQETDLTKAQQAVVEHVVAHGTKKNDGMPLTRVYIGGGCSDSLNEFDEVMEQLHVLGQDYITVLPSSVRELGYRRVWMAGQVPEIDEGPAGDQTTNDNGVGDSIDSSIEADTDAPTKIVFHPPLGDAGVVPAGEETRSRCENDLFQCAQRVLQEKPDATTFMYEFRPTMDWYGEQAKEGRGYEHIHVNSWEAFFNACRIEAGKDEAGEDEAESDEAVPAEELD